MTKAIRGPGRRSRSRSRTSSNSPRPRTRPTSSPSPTNWRAPRSPPTSTRRRACTPTAPRTLAASLAASHAQHLVVLRQALGAEPAESVPEAFEDGEVPPPGAPAMGMMRPVTGAPLRDRPLLLAPPLARRSPSGWSLAVALVVARPGRAAARPTTTSPCPAPARPTATELLEDNLPEQAYGSNPLVFEAPSRRKLTEPKYAAAIEETVEAAGSDAGRQLGGQPAQPARAPTLPQQRPHDRLHPGRPRRRPGRTRPKNRRRRILDAAEPAEAAGLETSVGAYVGQQLSKPDDRGQRGDRPRRGGDHPPLRLRHGDGDDAADRLGGHRPRLRALDHPPARARRRRCRASPRPWRR